MNKSAFYWKIIFEKILIIEQMFDEKNEKAKIFINLIVNVINNHKFHF